MGLFGKLFEKKECSICGGEIGLLGNRKLEDGNCCKECVRKLSPWFEERRHSTVEDIRRQLAYREENKKSVEAFQVTREFASDNYHVFIDDYKSQFAITVASGMNTEVNPDIVNLSQVKSCKLHIDQNRKKEQYRNEKGEMVDYHPPRYKYSYNYSIKLGINSPWFDDMDFKLNTFEVQEHDRRRIVDMENLGNQIVEALTGRGMNPAMNGMQGNMQGQAIPHAVQGNMNSQPMNHSMQSSNTQTWQCGCGSVNTAKFCQNCGQPNPVVAVPQQNYIVVRCDKCGWTPEDLNHIPKFCPSCGDPFDNNDIQR